MMVRPIHTNFFKATVAYEAVASLCCLKYRCCVYSSIHALTGTAGSDATQLTVSSLDESQRSLSVTESQPEDHDEELEMSLRSHSNSLVELYPSMISRIGRAWHRQHVTEAAGSVVRRYRRWQQQPNRSYLNKTFNVTVRRTSPNKMTNETLHEVMTNSPEKIHVMETGAAPCSPLQMLTKPKDWKAKHQSPGRVRGLLKGEPHQPIVVMDLSESCETSILKNISLNETFNVSQLEEPLDSHAVGPSRPSCSPAKTSLDLVHRHKTLSLAAHSPQADRSGKNAQQIIAAERSDIYRSPLKQSPLKARVMSSLSRSPLSFSRSQLSVESFSREPRSPSIFLPSPPRRPSVQRRMLYAPDSHHSFQPQVPSPQSAKGAGHHRLRRHLSFDSLLLTRISDSPKQVDEEFLKLYHMFVCQNKYTFFSGHPCRYCLKGSETKRSESSSALAALALSPHRSLLRKRHRELSLESHPQSKRFRDDHCKSSPGSKRYVNEMRRHSLSQSEYDGLSYSPGKRGSFSKNLPPAALSRETSADLNRSLHRRVFSSVFWPR